MGRLTLTIGVSEVEVIDRVERRRKWSEAEKAALLAEVEAVGGKAALVARRHRISESLLYNWRAAVRAAASTGPTVESVRVGRAEDVGLAMITAPAPAAPEPSKPALSRGSSMDERPGLIEINQPDRRTDAVEITANMTDPKAAGRASMQMTESSAGDPL